jgi:hypothetical protein
LHRYFLLFAMLSILLACQKKNAPADDLPQAEQFAKVYWQYLQLLAADSTKKEIPLPQLDSLLRQENLSREQFSESMIWYNAHPESWQKLLNALVDSLQRQTLPSSGNPVPSRQASATHAPAMAKHPSPK